jgi:hypothetical protein
MMAFFTHFSRNKSNPTSVTWRAGCACAFGLFVWLFLAPASLALAADVEFTQIKLERQDAWLELSTTMRFALDEQVEDALLKGVAVHFVLDVELYRDRWYWTDRKMFTARRTYRLSYQPLLRKWRLQIADGFLGDSTSDSISLSQQFDSLAETLAIIKRVSGWRVGESAHIDPDARHNFIVRFKLDQTRLPRIFQIGTLGTSLWRIEGEQYLRWHGGVAP